MSSANVANIVIAVVVLALLARVARQEAAGQVSAVGPQVPV
jgi:hypothetical protein